jgi:hypothetical protein
MVQPFLFGESVWIEVRDGNPAGLALFQKHYSYKPYRDGRSPKLFVGPGEKVVLLTPDVRALFIWRKFKCGDGQSGVNCAVFRNEGSGVASELIREAEAIAWQRWPGCRFYTYVNPRKVSRSRTPGRCFLKAGWRYVLTSEGKRAVTKCRRLLILEKRAEWQADAVG